MRTNHAIDKAGVVGAGISLQEGAQRNQTTTNRDDSSGQNKQDIWMLDV